MAEFFVVLIVFAVVLSDKTGVMLNMEGNHQHQEVQYLEQRNLFIVRQVSGEHQSLMLLEKHPML